MKKDVVNYFAPAKTAAEQLRRWDEGRSVWSIDLGGLGPGYEQAIQVLAIEIVRDHLNEPVSKNIAPTWADDTVRRIDVKLPDGKYSCGGFSGAQVGAAIWLAYHWLKEGPAKLQGSINPNKHIQVSNFWPRAAS